MEDERNAFRFFRSYWEAAKALPSDSDKVAFFDMVFEYAFNGKEPENVSGVPLAMFNLVKPNIDASNRKATQSRANGSRNNTQRTPKNNPEHTQKIPSAHPDDTQNVPRTYPSNTKTEPSGNPEHTAKNKEVGVRSKEYGERSKEVGVKEIPSGEGNIRAKRFTPPTLEEVSAYVKERGSMVDPQGFIDFYASKGWMVGKTPMKDWKAACRNAEHWDRWDKPVLPKPIPRDKSGDIDLIESYLHRRKADGAL